MSADAALKFEPPGPGVWELETTHFTKPVCRFMQGPTLEGFGLGFSESTAKYGVMLDRLEPGIVNDFIYMQPRPFGAPPGAKGPPPKLIFQILMRVVPKIRARIRTSQEAFETKRWRSDLEDWDKVVRPASDRKHREIQAVDPKSLTDEKLVDHLLVCRNQCRDMIRQHHQFTISCALPVGDLLAHVHEWTGKPAGEVLQVMRGSSKISLGVAAAELDTLAAKIRSDEAAKALLTSNGPPATVVERLLAHEGPVGEAMRAYIDTVGFRTLGYDVSSKYAIEMPEMLVTAIRASVAEDRAADTGGKARIAKLRAEIPKEHQEAFDSLLEEARAINRLRDERGHYSDGWATGLARRTLLEVGRRLKEKGKLSDPELVADASFEELRDLMEGKEGVASSELERRAKHRKTRTVTDADVPPWLGAEPSGPPPTEWLPEGGRRTQRAVNTFLSALFDVPKSERTATTVKGLPVSPGTYEGPARLVDNEVDFGRIKQGDVLVTRATSPYFNVVLPMLGAIVTDRGGQLSHAAIVSREYGIPGVVGTRDATKLVKDGARIRVDGNSGEVTVLE